MKQYYLALPGQPPSVVTPVQIQDLVSQKVAMENSLVVEVGGSQWTTLKLLFPELFAPAPPPLPEEMSKWLTPPPPLPPTIIEEDSFLESTVEALGEAGRRMGVHSTRLARAVHAFATRIMASNFTKAHASEQERKSLIEAKVQIRSTTSQNYAAWRRAMLWFASVGLTVSALSGTIDYFRELFDSSSLSEFIPVEITQQIGPANTNVLNNMVKNPAVLTVIRTILLLFKILAPICVIMAARQWTDVKRSRRLAWIGWLAVFIGPFFALILPIPSLMSNNYGIGGAIFNYQGVTVDLAPARLGMFSVFGMLFALVSLAPHVLSVFPGILRACITLRTLAPESPLPGWISMLVAPLYAMLFAIIVVVAAQSNHLILAAGLAFIMGLPLLTLLNVPHLSRPMKPDEMNQLLEKYKNKQSVLQWAGIILILIASGEYLERLGVWRIITTTLELVASIFFMTMVASDFILGLMRVAHEQSKSLQSSPLFPDLDRRYHDLAQVELTDFTGMKDDEIEPSVIITGVSK